MSECYPHITITHSCRQRPDRNITKEKRMCVKCNFIVKQVGSTAALARLTIKALIDFKLIFVMINKCLKIECFINVCLMLKHLDELLFFLVVHYMKIYKES